MIDSIGNDWTNMVDENSPYGPHKNDATSSLGDEAQKMLARLPLCTSTCITTSEIDAWLPREAETKRFQPMTNSKAVSYDHVSPLKKARRELEKDAISLG